MHPSGRNEGPTALVLDKSSKLPLCNDDNERDEQMKYHLITNEEAIKIYMENDGHDERFGENGQYSKREPRGVHSFVKLKTTCEQKKSIFSKLHHQNG